MNVKTEMEKVIHQSYGNIGGLIVQKKGTTVYETYLNDCTSQTPMNVFSVTKTITGILLGIAKDQGYIKSLDVKILDFFPDYQIKKGEQTIQRITLKDMMTMTVPYRYAKEPYYEYFTCDDWVTFALDSLGGKGRLGEFRYAPIIGPDIFTAILAEATGQSVTEFAQKNLFGPLGIHEKQSIEMKSEEENMAYLKSTNLHGWAVGPTGVNAGGWGLTLTAAEMLHLGELFLNQGKWNGQQIVSADWVRESTAQHSRCKEWKQDYGYLWWIINEKEHAYAAMGDSGNVIYINEAKDMVIAIASLYKQNAVDRLKLIKNYIEPAFL